MCAVKKKQKKEIEEDKCQSLIKLYLQKKRREKKKQKKCRKHFVKYKETIFARTLETLRTFIFFIFIASKSLVVFSITHHIREENLLHWFLESAKCAIKLQRISKCEDWL